MYKNGHVIILFLSQLLLVTFERSLWKYVFMCDADDDEFGLGT